MPRALIVEDEPEANKLLSLLIRLRGYQSESAFTGGQALELIRHGPFDVVLLDLMLPDINGFDVCRTLKADRRTATIPVVIVTARLSEENRAHSYAAGADEFVPKPYTPEQIFEALEVAGDRRRAIEGGGDSVEIRGDARPGVDGLRVANLVRALLMARSRLDPEAVEALSDATATLIAQAEAWGRQARAGRVATLSYHLVGDRFDLSVRDDSGWFHGGRPPEDEAWSRRVRPAFDAEEVAPSGDLVTLSKGLEQP